MAASLPGVTKRTGGTTKHQRQHHAQCCNGHQTHSMQHGAPPPRPRSPLRSSSAVTSALSSWKMLHWPEARSRHAVTPPGLRQCTVASGTVASGTAASASRQPAGGEAAGRREPALVIPPRRARLKWRHCSLFKLRHCLYLTSSRYGQCRQRSTVCVTRWARRVVAHSRHGGPRDCCHVPGTQFAAISQAVFPCVLQECSVRTS